MGAEFYIPALTLTPTNNNLYSSNADRTFGMPFDPTITTFEEFDDLWHEWIADADDVDMAGYVTHRLEEPITHVMAPPTKKLRTSGPELSSTYSPPTPRSAGPPFLTCELGQGIEALDGLPKPGAPWIRSNMRGSTFALHIEAGSEEQADRIERLASGPASSDGDFLSVQLQLRYEDQTPVKPLWGHEKKSKCDADAIVIYRNTTKHRAGIPLVCCPSFKFHTHKGVNSELCQYEPNNYNHRWHVPEHFCVQEFMEVHRSQEHRTRISLMLKMASIIGVQGF